MVDLFHVSVNALRQCIMRSKNCNYLLLCQDSGLSHTFKLISSTSENILNNFNVAV